MNQLQKKYLISRVYNLVIIKLFILRKQAEEANASSCVTEIKIKNPIQYDESKSIPMYQGTHAAKALQLVRDFTATCDEIILEKDKVALDILAQYT